jgi:hypothetical protein
MNTFRRELQNLINKHSKENGSDTPDFILAEYLTDCLKTFDKTIKLRNTWYGMTLHADEKIPLTETDYQQIAESINNTRICARATLYPGKSIDEIPRVTAEDLMPENICKRCGKKLVAQKDANYLCMNPECDNYVRILNENREPVVKFPNETKEGYPEENKHHRINKNCL